MKNTQRKHIQGDVKLLLQVSTMESQRLTLIINSAWTIAAVMLKTTPRGPLIFLLISGLSSQL